MSIMKFDPYTKLITTELEANSGKGELGEVNKQMAALVKGIAAMNAMFPKLIENTTNLKKETEDVNKESKGLLRSFSKLSKIDKENPWGKTFGKQWLAIRRMTSGTFLWAYQNALVGVMNQTSVVLDLFGGKGTGTKLFTKLGKNLKGTGKKLKTMFAEEKGVQQVRELEKSIGIGKVIQDERNIVGGKRLDSSVLRQVPTEFIENLQGLVRTDVATEEEALKMVHDYIKMNIKDKPKQTIRQRVKDRYDKVKEKVTKMDLWTNNKLKKFRGGLSKVNILAAFRTFMRIAGVILKFIVGFFALVFIFKALKLDKALKGIWDTIVIMVKAVIFGVVTFAKGIGNLIGGFVDLYNAIGDFVETGEWMPIIEALGRIVTGGLQIVGGLVWAVVGPIIELIYGWFVNVLWGWVTSFTSDAQEWWQKALSMGLLILTAVGVIATFFMMPFGLAAILVAAVVAGVGMLLQKFIPGRAMGGPANGLTLVGEKGPELVNLPSGSHVYSNSDSRRIATGMTNNITVNVQGRIGASDSELREIAQKVGRMINLELNRTTSTRTRGA